MSTAPKYNPITVSEYLFGESRAERKHEYVEGVIYAMAGATINHNRIATNATVALGIQLRGKRCEVFNSDTKVRIQTRTGIRFYYPDAMVVCDPNPPEDTFHDSPRLICEVLSDSTRRIDGFEKRLAYLALGSLEYYLRVEPEQPMVLLDLRIDDKFETHIIEGLDAVIELPTLDFSLPLAELYANVRFPTEEEIRERQELYG
jgi:Uma2 family endonuclease